MRQCTSFAKPVFRPLARQGKARIGQDVTHSSCTESELAVIPPGSSRLAFQGFSMSK